MKVWDAIPADIWNSLSLDERKSLVTYLKFIGHRVNEDDITYSDVAFDSAMVLDSYGDLWPLFIGIGIHHLSEKEVRDMIRISPI